MTSTCTGKCTGHCTQCGTPCEAQAPPARRDEDDPRPNWSPSSYLDGDWRDENR